jgi:hypothetical protein
VATWFAQAFAAPTRTQTLGWPAIGVMVVVYGLIGFGVVGNIVIPLVTR